MKRWAAWTAAAALTLAVPATAEAFVYVGADLATVPNQVVACASCAGLTFAVAGSANHDTIPSDGVVVAWLARTNGSQTVALLLARRGATGDYTRVAEATGSTSATDVTRFAARIPVRRGDFIGLSSTGAGLPYRSSTASSVFLGFQDGVGTTPVAPGPSQLGELPVAVHVEPDTDRDDFGDETQDECPADPTRQEAPCTGVRVGPSLLGLWGAPGLAATTLANLDAAAPADGVLVRWRTRASAAPVGLQVLRPDPAGFRHAGETEAVVGTEVAHITTTPARLPMQAGDILALRLFTPANVGTRPTAGPTVGVFPTMAPGSPAGPSSTVTDQEVALNADVEPDADGDGFGDVSQDGCPNDPTTFGACPPAPPPPPPAPVTVTVTQLVPQPAGQVASRVLRPGAARLAVRRLRYRGTRSLSVPLTCPGDAESCKGVLELKVRKRAAGKRAFSLRPGQRKNVSVRLSARARRALRRGGKVRARIVPAGPAATNGSLTLTR